MSERLSQGAVSSVWHAGARLASRPSVAGDLSADLVVIGCGGAGLAAARAAALAGMSVIALDAGTLGQYAAGANAGFLLCGGSAFFHDAEQKWGSAFTRALWEITEAELEEQTRLWPDAVNRCSSRRVAGWPNPETAPLIDAASLRVEEDDLRAQHRAQLEAGIDVELVEFRDALSLVVRTDGWCDPVLRLSHARESALAAGASVFEHSRAELRGEPGAWIVTTSRASISAGTVLFATDAYLDEQLPELTGQVETWRLQMLAVREHAPSFDSPTYMRNGFDYAINSAHGLALGGLRDRHMHSETSNSFKRGATAASPLQDELAELARHLVGTDVHVHRQWAAPVGYTRDGLPFVSEVRPGVWAVGAYNGHGNLLSYALGKAVVSALVGSNDRAIELLGR
jgi:gamma-glutamylputrescine oxidase